MPWKDEYYLKSYQLALDGMTENQIAAQLGTTISTYRKWKKTKKALRIALLEGQSRNAKRRKVTGLKDYLYQQLSPEMQEVWTELERCAKHHNPIQRMEALFDNHGEETRKHMFLHAFSTTQFNPTMACKKVGINRSCLKRWMEDPVFAELMDDLEWNKNNYFESKLVDLVEEGDSKAIMFVNRTRNRDRGYAEKMETIHSGEITHEHKSLLDVTMLPLKLQQQILDYMEQEERKQLTAE